MNLSGCSRGVHSVERNAFGTAPTQRTGEKDVDLCLHHHLHYHHHHHPFLPTVCHQPEHVCVLLNSPLCSLIEEGVTYLV